MSESFIRYRAGARKRGRERERSKMEREKRREDFASMQQRLGQGRGSEIKSVCG